MAVDRALLHRFPALRSLGPPELRSLSHSMEAARYRRGSQLCREGDEDDRCFFLVSGTVDVTKTLPDGRRLRLAELSEGIIFGQAGLVKDQARTAEVRALTDVEVLQLRRLPLEYGLRNRRKWALLIHELAAVSLVRQLRGALAYLEALAKGEQEAEVRGGAADRPRAAPAAGVLDPSLEPTLKERLRARDEPPAPRPEADEGSSMAGLMRLLAETESTLGDLSESRIRVVVDEEQKRNKAKKR